MKKVPSKFEKTLTYSTVCRQDTNKGDLNSRQMQITGFSFKIKKNKKNDIQIIKPSASHSR